MKLSEFKAFMGDVMAEFYATETNLLKFGKDGNKMAHERTISFRIGYIVLNKLKYYYGLENYTVDAEYNKHGIDPRRFDGKDVYPDLLIHKRGIDDYNLAWIEVKKQAVEKAKLIKTESAYNASLNRVATSTTISAS